ncbi:MAG TPA: DUF3592 domain-containing protein [Roseiflexaceae bacterium]|nr:DUF3592 domain-containing protein [Roseiflexaceae bacterium]
MGKASRRKRMFRTGAQVYTGRLPTTISRRELIMGFAVLLLLLGWVGYLLAGEAGKVWTATTSAGWPSARGEVLGGRVEAVPFGQGRWERNTFRPVVSYRYRVAGREYNGATYRLHPPTLDTRAEAERVVASYALGSSATVFYNPDAPGEAYLAASFLTARDYLALVVLGVFFALLLGLVALGLLPDHRPLRLHRAGRSAV